MKILITNQSLNGYTGSETWVYAMVKELEKNHDVTVMTLLEGLMSDRLECEVITEYKGSYDLAIVNHLYDMLPKDLFKIFTSHSLIYEVEEFPDCEYKVGVTEAVAKGNPVIRNGIDCKRFKPTQVNKELKNILYLSNTDYQGGLDFIKEACQGYNLTWIKENRFDIENLIDKADLVISLGRGALESMACGKNVIYGDLRNNFMTEFKGGGMITSKTYDSFKLGEWQTDRKVMTLDELREEIKKYNPDNGTFNRQMILKDFNITKTSKQYLDIYEKEHKKRVSIL